MQRGIDPSTESGGLNWLSGDSEMRGSSTESEVPRKGENVVSK